MFSFPPKQVLTVEDASIEYVRVGGGATSVVLINGSGGPVEGWHKILGPVAAIAKVFAYNRPGIGKSSKPAVPQLASHMVASLRAALLAAAMPPPYVLVGHSMGGLIANLYARLHPSEVKAVVLLEATAPDDPAVLAQHENRVQRTLRRFLAWLVPPTPFSETSHVASSVRELKAAPPFPPLPLIVITGGRPTMAWATAPEALAARASHQRALAALSPRGKQLLAHRSGHFPQFTESELVVSAIEEAIDAPSST